MPSEKPTVIQHQLSSASDCTGGSGKEGTPYQRLLHAIHNDPRWLAEVSLGKRVGFYRFRGDLGSGNFSQVKMAVHQLTREAVAVKILDKSKLDAKTRKMLAREISTMEAIHHPNIIRLYEVVETYSKIHLVMEYANGGELFNKISTAGRLTEQEAKPLFAQVVSAVLYMHEHSLIHRDIKAENVFYAGPALVKLGDFGFSTQLTAGSNEQLRTFCGSPPYAAPELFRDDSYVGAPVDIWALGVLLYFMVTAQMPFRAQTVAALKQHILLGMFAPPTPASPHCAALIEGILRQTPRDRLSLSKICQSEWFSDIELPAQPGPYETYILTPTPLPRKFSILTLNGYDTKSALTPLDATSTLVSIDAKSTLVSIDAKSTPVSASNQGITKLDADDQLNQEDTAKPVWEVRLKDDSKNNGNLASENESERKTSTEVPPNKLERNSSSASDPSGRASPPTSSENSRQKLEQEYRSFGITEIEIRAREKLHSLGLTGKMLEEHSSLGAKSSIIGAYRILVHRMQKIQGNVDSEPILLDDVGAVEVPTTNGTRNNHFLANIGRRKSKSANYKTKGGTKVLQRHRSKTCVII